MSTPSLSKPGSGFDNHPTVFHKQEAVGVVTVQSEEEADNRGTPRASCPAHIQFGTGIGQTNVSQQQDTVREEKVRHILHSWHSWLHFLRKTKHSSEQNMLMKPDLVDDGEEKKKKKKKKMKKAELEKMKEKLQHDKAEATNLPLLSMTVAGLIIVLLCVSLACILRMSPRTASPVFQMESTHSPEGSSSALLKLVFVQGQSSVQSVNCEIETEGRCPIPIRWLPTPIDRELRYDIPIQAPCKKNRFKCTVTDKTGDTQTQTNTLEAKKASDIKSSSFVPDHVRHVRQAGKDLFQWTPSPCADKYLVRVVGDPTLQFVTEENRIILNISSNCEKIPLEVEAHSGEQSSPPSVQVVFDPCASERDPDGELSPWMKQHIFVSQIEDRATMC